MDICQQCKTEYTPHYSKQKTGSQKYCSTNCARAKRYLDYLEKNYGLDTVNSLYEEQDGKCAICRVFLLFALDDSDVRVDHNHKTGQVRGLLCNSCNRSLGMFKDSPEMLLRAYNYLCEKGYYGAE